MKISAVTAPSVSQQLFNVLAVGLHVNIFNFPTPEVRDHAIYVRAGSIAFLVDKYFVNGTEGSPRIQHFRYLSAVTKETKM
jgi:hypothetical protein